MSRFAKYLDAYPDILPGDIYGPKIFQSDEEDEGSFFQNFLALQNNPTSVLLKKISIPDNLRQFMNMGGIQ